MIRKKTLLPITLILCLSLLACSLANLSQPDASQTPRAAQPTLPASTQTAPPTLLPPTEAPAASQPTPTIPVIQGDAPVILNEFPLEKKYFGFTRITSTARKLWITTFTGHMLIYDTSGQMLKEILLPEKPGRYNKGWLTYDDNYVWVMISTKEGRKDQGLCSLFRINIADYEVLPVDLPETVKDITLGQTINPFWMGLAAKPGELWVGGIDHLLIYEAENPQNVRDIQDQWTIQSLMWDGEYMWGGMSYCAPQQFLMPIDPDYVSNEPCMRPRVPVDVDWMFRYKDLIWVGSIDQMLAYNADRVTTSTYDDPAYPEIELPFRSEHNLFIKPTYDGRYLWDLDLGWGDMYSYDPASDMQEVGQFSFMQPGEDGAVFDIAFDGHFIWGLKFDNIEYHLVQVGLSWVK